MNNGVNEKFYQNFTIVNLAILLASIFLLFLYWVLHEYFEPTIKNSYFALICKEIGMAGLIALILNISIEFVNRKKHNEDKEELISLISKELFKAVYGRNIDKSIVTQLDNYLFSSMCIRRGYRNLIQLNMVSGGDNSMATFTSSVSYLIENVTSKRVSIPLVKCVIDSVDSNGFNSFKKMSINGKDFLGDDLAQYINPSADKRVTNLFYEDYLEPKSSIEVSYEFERLVHARSSEAIVTTIPMDSFELNVIDKNESFKIDAFSLHPLDEALVIDNGVLKEWRINDSIIPGQGFLLIWEPC
jgi:hypothetical protein